MTASQQEASPQTVAMLETLQASCIQQQDRLTEGIQQLSERLARSGAVMRFVCRHRSTATAPPHTTPVGGCLAAGMRSHCSG